MKSTQLFLAAAGILAGTSTAVAATQTWQDANGDNNWNTTATNWDAGTIWTNGNDAIFGGTGESITLGTGITAHNLTFNSTGYSISGNTLTLATATPTITTATGVTATINSIVTGTVGLSKAGAGTLSMSGANTYSGNTAVTAGTLEISGSGTLGTSASYAGAISISSGATFRYASSATQDLTAQHTLAGTFEIASGQVNLAGSNNQLGAADNAGGLLLIRDGGILNNKLTTTAHSIRTNIELRNGGKMTSTGTNTSGFGDFFLNVNGTIIGTGSGNIISASKIGINTGKTLTLTTALSSDSLLVSSQIIAVQGGANVLSKTGAGVVTLTGTNTYAGGTTISGGTLITGNTAALSTGAVNVNTSGATLQVGNGTVNTVALGSAATLAIANGAILKLGAFNAASLDGASGVITLAGTGTYTFNTSGKLDLNSVLDGITSGTHDYRLFTGGNGVFAGGELQLANISGYGANITLNSFTNGVLNFTAVPEPSTYGLIGAGVLAVVSAVRRRRKHVGETA